MRKRDWESLSQLQLPGDHTRKTENAENEVNKMNREKKTVSPIFCDKTKITKPMHFFNTKTNYQFGEYSVRNHKQR